MTAPDPASINAEAALAAEREKYERQPASLTARFDYAAALLRLGRPDEALPHFRELSHGSPANARVWLGLVAACIVTGRVVEAENHARAACRHHPTVPEIELNFAACLSRLGEYTEAVAILRKLLARNPQFGKAQLALASGLNYLPGASCADIVRAHAAVGRMFGAAAPPRRPANPDPDRRLRIGILSADLREHSVAYFVEPLLANLDSGAADESGEFTVCVFDAAGEGVADAVTARLQTYTSEWQDVSQLDAPRLDAALRRANLDILIELSGFTIGQRLAGLVQRPAPIQMTYLGYPSTTGCPFIDYRIVDGQTDPPLAQRDHPSCTEKIAHLDPCFLCYRPPTDLAPVRDRDDGPIVFACFGALQKYSDELLRLWGRVLQAAPGAKLLLKSRGLEDSDVRDRIARRLLNAGVEEGRVVFMGRTDRAADHLALYHRADIAIDTFPYNGTTTTCEAAWMGVPTVTLAGQTHASRVGLTLLTNMGLPHLAAKSEDEFVRTAATLAADGEQLRTLRSSLRQRMKESALMDAPAFGARFGAMLRSVWQRAVVGSSVQLVLLAGCIDL